MYTSIKSLGLSQFSKQLFKTYSKLNMMCNTVFSVLGFIEMILTSCLLLNGLKAFHLDGVMSTSEKQTRQL